MVSRRRGSSKLNDDATNTRYIGIAADGLDGPFIRERQMKYLKGEALDIGSQDVNRASKNAFGQLVGGTTVKLVGLVVFDVGLLRLAGVPDAVIRRKDFASDATPLHGTNEDTIAGILSLAEAEGSLTTVTAALTLVFLRAVTFAHNAEPDQIDDETRVKLMWAGVLWLNSIKGVSIITKRNLLACCIGGMFCAAAGDVVKTHLCSEEVRC